MFYRQGLSAALLALLATASVQATVLTYDFSGSPGVANDDPLPADYGDNVTSTSMPRPSGTTYGYGQFGEGFTPNIIADHGDAQFYGPDYGDLTNVAFANDGTFSLTLTSDFANNRNVQILSFDMAGAGGSYQINSISITNQNNVVLFSQTNPTIAGSNNGTGRTSFSFLNAPLQGEVLTLSFDASNLGGTAYNIGIDNIQFAQVPEPSVTALALSAAGLGFLVRRFRRSSTRTA